ncbi:hypothetical protein KC19_7G086000 [Ceratodon purpureus]|uniref:Transmembrane protein n=1 Tax=Ceratodon purpureus TaxID=3225 RepID=A0A8T0H983_CERPU|nr:hypothetical protein KC19_7G086000 [Ceratodon purpureus]
MTITVNWTITIPNRADTFQRLQSKRIVIWAPTSLTSISTFRATVAAICLLGIFIICCFCSLNTVAVSSLRRFSVTLARETRDQQECEQNRVFNPLWMPCAPTLADYNIESTPNPLMLMQRRKELKTKILRMRTPFSLMDRILRASHVKTSHYTCVRCRFPCAPASPPLRDSSSDDDKSDTLEAASKNRSGCCLRSPGSDDGTPSSEVDRDSTTPRDPQLLSAQPCDPPQVGSQPVAPSTAIPALTQANWRPSQQGATRDIEKYPAEPGIYLRDQYNRQDGGPQGNRGGSENITVGYAFVQHRLAPSQGVHVDPNLTCARNRFVFGAEDEILDPTLATKILDSVSDSEVEEEVVAESDLEFESEMRFEAASNLGDGSSLSFSRGLRVSESPPAERGSDSGRTSECFRSPLSDLYEDVLESCSPISSRRSPWRSDASMYADPSALRMQQRS